MDAKVCKKLLSEMMTPIHLLEASGVPARGLDYCTQEAVLSQRTAKCGSPLPYTHIFTPCMCIQWTPSILDTIGNQYFDPYRTLILTLIGVPNSGASGIFLVGVVLRNQAVEHNVATFFEHSTKLLFFFKVSTTTRRVPPDHILIKN